MGGGGQREGHGARIWPNKHKMALISEYLAADLSPDASADALAIIKIGKAQSQLELSLAQLSPSLFNSSSDIHL